MATSARTRLRRILLRIGGIDVDFIEDPYLQVIADAGAPFVDTTIRITRGRPNECHRNAAIFWLKGKCAAIAVGYYLRPDDVWRQHSWGVIGDGTILDTHSAGRQYFGARVESVEAMEFAESHVSLTEVERLMKPNPERFRPVFEECFVLFRQRSDPNGCPRAHRCTPCP
jgi:hypothetical protein